MALLTLISNSSRICQQFLKADNQYAGERIWTLYECATCGNVVLTEAERLHKNPNQAMDILTVWPQVEQIPVELPERAQQFLQQAFDSRDAPAGAVVLAAGAIDSMLKAKDYTKGTLNDRINLASKEHLITDEMAAWAHDIRLDANDQRHADEVAPLPQQADAKKVIRFAMALGQFLYVLPAMVTRGRKEPKQNASPTDMPEPVSRTQVRSNAPE